MNSNKTKRNNISQQELLLRISIRIIGRKAKLKEQLNIVELSLQNVVDKYIKRPNV